MTALGHSLWSQGFENPRFGKLGFRGEKSGFSISRSLWASYQWKIRASEVRRPSFADGPSHFWPQSGTVHQQIRALRRGPHAPKKNVAQRPETTLRARANALRHIHDCIMPLRRGRARHLPVMVSGGSFFCPEPKTAFWRLIFFCALSRFEIVFCTGYYL